MFEETLQRLALRFLKPSAITKVQNQFDNAKYSWETGIHEFVENLKRISKHLFLEVDAFTLRKKIIEAIPADMRRTIINIKGLSTTTSSIKEWVAAIDRREREILEYKAFEEGNRQRTTPYSNAQMRDRRLNTQTHEPQTTAQTRDQQRVKTNNKPPQQVRTGECTMPTGPMKNTRQQKLLNEVKCFACGKTGHYKGSKECPKTPMSARLHAMGVGEADQETMEQDKSPFEGDEYDGEEDPEMGKTEDEAEIEEDLGFSVTAMFIKDNEMATEEEEQIHLAAISVAGRDAKIADEIVKTIKEQYEERGSGQKP